MIEFSEKQRRVMDWWKEGVQDSQRDAIICDGAVRSGKTLCIGISFICWAMCNFSQKKFAICGKTAGAIKRNLLSEVKPFICSFGFSWKEKMSEHTVEISIGERRNIFYLFGGKDEGAAAHIQGMTLAGALLDEVALMPRSFVEQVCARCSVEGSRFWFSCNPDSPEHWFYKEWIEKRQEKHALYLHFTMEDNPALSQRVKNRYRKMFHGVFYRRFVLGQWVAGQGLVYDFFGRDYIEPAPKDGFSKWVISCDYGTVNPTSMGLWGQRGKKWYRVEEFYYDARKQGVQKTDGDYLNDLKTLAGDRQITAVIVDPAAASFIVAVKRAGFPVLRADNRVLPGIRVTAQRLKDREIIICDGCTDAIREFGLYQWKQGQDRDQVQKEHDHAMDEIRYFAMYLSRQEGQGGMVAASIERRG